VDFSENATIAAQKEVQAAYWHHSQATLFTTHAWINKDTNFNMVGILDELDHAKYSISFSCSMFFTVLEQNFQSSHQMICLVMDQHHNLNRDFSFQTYTIGSKLMKSPSIFATFHGKGIVDEIGGTVKRTV